MSNECLTCGSKIVDSNRVNYMVNPGHIIPGGGSSYLLCDKHKHLRYYFEDVYDENAKRKDIDHEAVILRSYVNEKLETEIHNAKAKKNMEKFIKSGKLTDEDGNEIKIGETVNFEKIENASS